MIDINNASEPELEGLIKQLTKRRSQNWMGFLAAGILAACTAMHYLLSPGDGTLLLKALAAVTVTCCIYYFRAMRKWNSDLGELIQDCERRRLALATATLVEAVPPTSGV